MNKLKVALVATLFSIGIHFYLSMITYPVKLAQTEGKLACDISSTFNCSSVIASEYSSIFGISLSVLGMMANLVLLLFLIIYILRLSEQPQLTLRYTLYLSTLIAIASVVMGFISFTKMQAKCPFCIAAYFFSFLTLLLVFLEAGKDAINTIGHDLKNLMSEGRTALIMIVSIPVLSLIVNNAFLTQSGAENIESTINYSIEEWQFGKTNEFLLTPVFSLGPKDAKVRVVEFADYLCPHCKHAAPSISAFLSSRKDVRFDFFSFPLDGTCNPEIPNKSDGVRCLLAKAVACSNQQSTNTNLGEMVHHKILEKQESFYGKSYEQAKNYLQEELSQKVDWAKLDTCLESEEMQNTIKEHASMAGRAGIKGTPSIYVNDKLLPNGQLIPVLNKAYSKIIQ